MSVLELCVRGAGVHRGALAASYVARYAMTMHRLGKFPTAVEYGEDWAIRERSAWRHRQFMQEALGDPWPQVVEHVALELHRRELGVNAAQKISVPATVLAAA